MSTNNILNIKNLEGTIEDQLNTIGDNFNILANSAPYKGDTGDTPHISKKYLFQNINNVTYLTTLGIGVISSIIPDTDTGDQLTQNITWTNSWDNIVSKFSEKYASIDSVSVMDIFKTSNGSWNLEYSWDFWSEEYDEYNIYSNDSPVSQFIFIDARTQVLTEISSYILEDSEEFYDLSCVSVGNVSGYNIISVERSNMFPTLYYNNVDGNVDSSYWCWKVNGNYTGICAEGVAGKTSNGRLHLISSTDTDNLVTSCKYFYEGVWLSYEQYLSNSGLTLESGSIGYLLESIDLTSTGDLSYSNMYIKIVSFVYGDDNSGYWSEVNTLTSSDGTTSNNPVICFSEDFYNYVITSIFGQATSIVTSDTSSEASGIILPILTTTSTSSTTDYNYKIHNQTVVSSSDSTNTLYLYPNPPVNEDGTTGSDVDKYNLSVSGFNNINFSTTDGYCAFNDVDISSIFSPYTNVINSTGSTASSAFKIALEDENDPSYIYLNKSMDSSNPVELSSNLQDKNILVIDGKMQDIYINNQYDQIKLFGSDGRNNIIMNTNIHIESDYVVNIGPMNIIDNCNIYFSGGGRLKIESNTIINTNIYISDYQNDIGYIDEGVLNNCTSLNNVHLYFTDFNPVNPPENLFNCVDNFFYNCSNIINSNTYISTSSNNFNGLKLYNITFNSTVSNLSSFISEDNYDILLLDSDLNVIGTTVSQSTVTPSYYVILNGALTSSNFNKLFANIYQYITEMDFPYDYEFDGVYDNMFANMRVLNKITNIKLKNTISCEDMFSGCYCLEYVNIESEQINVDCSGMFRNCMMLEYVDLPNRFIGNWGVETFKNSSILCTSINGDFKNHTIPVQYFYERVQQNQDLTENNDTYYILHDSKFVISDSSNVLINAISDSTSLSTHLTDVYLTLFQLKEDFQIGVDNFSVDYLISGINTNPSTNVYKIGVNKNIFNIARDPAAFESTYLDLEEATITGLYFYNFEKLFMGCGVCHSDIKESVVLYPYNPDKNHIINCYRMLSDCYGMNTYNVPNWVLNPYNTFSPELITEDNVTLSGVSIDKYDKEIFIKTS